MTQEVFVPSFLAGKHRELDQDGYIVIPSVISQKLCRNLCESIKNSLKRCALEIDCCYEDYLASVSRWVDPSIITAQCKKELIPTLQDLLSVFLPKSQLIKLNIISKTPYACGAIPLHQDISYSPENPYSYTAWLALTDVPVQSGPLEVIPGSHRWPIKKAVDFWDPSYREESLFYNHSRAQIPVSCGDMIIFNACLWHGSGSNQLDHERFAFVTRWRSPDFEAPFIPTISPSFFGMWTCQEKTLSILTQSWHQLFQETPPVAFDQLLINWKNVLTEKSFLFIPYPKKAIQALQNVYILHKAHTLHNGGDGQGTVYKTLWDQLLIPLIRTLNILQELPHGFIPYEKAAR